MDFNVVFSASYPVEAETEEEAIKKAKELLNRDCNTTDSEPSEVMTSIEVS